METNNARIPWYFAAYAVATGLLFLSLPRLFAQAYWMPWDYSWVFLTITPLLAGAFLVGGFGAGRFSWWAVALFVFAALLLGVGYWQFSLNLAGVV